MTATVYSARLLVALTVKYDDPVTRGALALVCDRAVLIPLLDLASAPPDPAYDGYLFRLPRALGVRDAAEREALVRLVPKASAVPYEVLGRGEPNASALAALVARATGGRWQWADFVEGVDREVRARRGSRGRAFLDTGPVERPPA